MQLDTCAVCGSTELRQWFSTTFGAIGRCDGCGQILRADSPTVDSMVLAHRTGRLHESAYATNSETATHDLSFVTRFVELAVANAPVRRVLDVGCSTGHCLARFEALGFDCVGIEPVAELREVARRRLDGVVIAAPIEEVELEPGSFGAVVLWDSIEHLVDPRAVLEKVKSWLCPGGLLGIATLNHDSLMYSIYHVLRRPLPAIAQGFGDRLYNPFHTYYFTMRSLARLVDDTGLSIEQHKGYEFPLSRLDASKVFKAGMRGLYAIQWLTGTQGEQYMFARKPPRAS